MDVDEIDKKHKLTIMQHQNVFMVQVPGATFTTLHFLLYFKNGLNNLVCYITLVWNGLSGEKP